MTLRRETSDEVFARLSSDKDGSASLEVRDTDVKLAGGAIAHAVDGGRRLLLLPLTPDEESADDRGSYGVTLIERVLMDRGSLVRYQSVACEYEELWRPFSLLCDELIEELTVVAVNPAGVAQQVLDRWRELLAPRKSRLLGPNSLIGLLAELRVLEEMASSHSPSEVLRLWTGPTGARFDFVGERGAVEVKSTTSRDRFVVTIHGLSQLEPPTGGSLVLYAQQVELVPVGGDSVPDAIDRLLGMEFPASTLLNRLALLGYDHGDRNAYQETRVVQNREVALLVDQRLPRLTRDSLRDPSISAGLHNVSYGIDLADRADVGASANWSLIASTLWSV